MNIRFDHQLGERLTQLQERALKEAYLALYAFAGAKKSDHFIFTSSGAEGVNHAVFAAYLDITRKTGKNHFLCGDLSEAPAIMAMSRLQEVGCVFQKVPAGKEGYVSSKSVAEMLTPRTAMLSLSWANGLTGVLQPLREIGEMCKERGVLFHIEASHVLGKGDFSFEESGADLMSFNGAVAGTGGLFIRDHVEISPFILGGNEQGQMRGGSFAFSGLIELAKWAKEERGHTDHYGLEIARLRSLFEETIWQRVQGARPLLRDQARVPHITTLLFPGVASDALYYLLTQKGIHATFGGGQMQHLVHILKACGVPQPDCHTGLSFAFAASTTEEEIIEGAEKVAAAALQLSTYSKGLFV